MLLREQLSEEATYRGFEPGGRMAAIAASRLRPWAARTTVTRIDGDPPLPHDAGTDDRVVANFVLDLIPPAEGRRRLGEAHRVLGPAGLLCLVSITTSGPYATTRP